MYVMSQLQLTNSGDQRKDKRAQNSTIKSVYDGNHDGVVRILVRHYIILHYVEQFLLYQECNITFHNV